MDFQLSDEQTLIVSTVRNFLEKEIYPHEKMVEETGVVPKSLGLKLQKNVKKSAFLRPIFLQISEVGV